MRLSWGVLSLMLLHLACHGSTGSDDAGTDDASGSFQSPDAGSRAADAGVTPISCVSDVECPSDRSLCDPTRHRCTACFNDLACGKGAVCDSQVGLCRNLPVLKLLVREPLEIEIAGVVWDPIRSRAIRLVAGSTAFRVDEYSGGKWTAVTLSGTAPALRNGPAVAWDGTLKKVLVFGGEQGQGSSLTALNDTWSWDGSKWESLSSGAIPARSYASMAWDPGRSRVVLFGGVRQSNPVADTWEWNGSSWQLVPVTGPTARQSAALGWDSSTGGLLLVGGRGPGHPAYGCGMWSDFCDTSEYASAEWTVVATSYTSDTSEHPCGSVADLPGVGPVTSLCWDLYDNQGTVGFTKLTGTLWQRMSFYSGSDTWSEGAGPAFLVSTDAGIIVVVTVHGSSTTTETWLLSRPP